MEIVKKIIGVLFIGVGGIIILSFFGNMPNMIKSASNDLAYNLGYFGSAVVLLLLAIFLVRLGIKWIRKRPKLRKDHISDIGVKKD